MLACLLCDAWVLHWYVFLAWCLRLAGVTGAVGAVSLESCIHATASTQFRKLMRTGSSSKTPSFGGRVLGIAYTAP